MDGRGKRTRGHTGARLRRGERGQGSRRAQLKRRAAEAVAARVRRNSDKLGDDDTETDQRGKHGESVEELTAELVDVVRRSEAARSSGNRQRKSAIVGEDEVDGEAAGHSGSGSRCRRRRRPRGAGRLLDMLLGDGKAGGRGYDDGHGARELGHRHNERERGTRGN